MAQLDPTNTKLLCHFNGTNGATTYTSDDAYARTATFAASAQLSTAQKVFGTASLMLDEVNNDYLTFPASADFNLGTGAFTYGGRLYTGNLSSYTDSEWYFLLGHNDTDAGGAWLYHFPGETVLFGFSNSGSSFEYWTALSDNTWYAWEWNRDSNGYFYLFINGTLALFDDGQPTVTVNITATNPFRLGASTWGRIWGTFHIDELYIIKGQALHTSNYTPETEEYTIPTGGYMTTNKGYWGA